MKEIRIHFQLSQEQKLTWGDCPICPAKHGQRCNAAFGIKLGVGGDGSGAHLARLQNTPEEAVQIFQW